MEITLAHLIFLLAGLLIGGTIMVLVTLQRQGKKHMTLSSELNIIKEQFSQTRIDNEKLDRENSGLKELQSELEDELNDVKRQLAVNNQEILELGQYKTEVTESREKIITLSNARSEQEEKLKQLSETRQTLVEKELVLESLRNDNKVQTSKCAQLEEKLHHYAELTEELERLQHEFSQCQKLSSTRQAEIAKLSTLLQNERDSSTEKLDLLNQAKEEMANRFKTVAQEIFEEKGAKFNTNQEKQLGTILDPLKEQITTFQKRINDIHHTSSKDQASLRQELETLRRSNFDLNKEAKNLTHALKGDKKVQGNWGEMILEKVLEQSGLRKGIEYETQSGHRDDDNKLLKPDVIVHLPEGRDVIIDSKVSLIAYEKSCSIDDEGKKQQALDDHVLAVRTHINLLSTKDYGNIPGLKSPDFVLMFMPIEPAFMAAFQADDSLFNYGFEKRIIVVTPTTLLATLRTIENIWRFERQNQNTKAIASLASKVYDKLRLFLEDMDKLGKQLNTATGTYDNAIKRLSQGQGNLLSQAEKFVELGVKVKKELPKSMLEISYLDKDKE